MLVSKLLSLIPKHTLLCYDAGDGVLETIHLPDSSFILYSANRRCERETEKLGGEGLAPPSLFLTTCGSMSITPAMPLLPVAAVPSHYQQLHLFCKFFQYLQKQILNII